MGFEYLIIAKQLPVSEAQLLLKHALGGSGVETSDGWEFRRADTKGSMPDVVVQRIDDGFYVMVTGVMGLNAELLGYLTLRTAGFGPVTVTLLEE